MFEDEDIGDMDFNLSSPLRGLSPPACSRLTGNLTSEAMMSQPSAQVFEEDDENDDIDEDEDEDEDED